MITAEEDATRVGCLPQCVRPYIPEIKRLLSSRVGVTLLLVGYISSSSSGSGCISIAVAVAAVVVVSSVTQSNNRRTMTAALIRYNHLRNLRL